MNHFLIKYQFTSGSEQEWRKHIADFIGALDSYPDLRDRISYRVMKERDGTGYYHLATALDAEASAALSRKDFFKTYTDEIKRVAGGEVTVVPLELIGETKHRV